LDRVLGVEKLDLVFLDYDDPIDGSLPGVEEGEVCLVGVVEFYIDVKLDRGEIKGTYHDVD
jgi:hypothetical protein